MNPKVFIRRGRAGAPLGRNPWVTAHDLEKFDQTLEDGSVVDLFEGDRFLARGFFNSKSRLVLRLLTWKKDEVIDERFLKQKISEAMDLRISTRILDRGNSVRWIFGEADGLPGLVADQFGSVLILQVTSLGLYKMLEPLVKIFRDLLEGRGPRVESVILKEEKSHWEKEGIPEISSRTLWGTDVASFEVSEGDLKFLVSLKDSHKTGFYLDQRENRKKLRDLSAGRSVLDLCCYTGGFSLQALKGGATSVLGIDSSRPAIDQARKNLERSGITDIDRVQFLEADFSEWAKQNDQTFDIVVLDPPKLIPGQKFKKQGLRTYYFYNELALAKVKHQGFLLTFSCSGSLTTDEFQALVTSVARRRGYSLQMIDTLGAPPDHPVLLSAPSTQYLKGFVFRVTKAL